MRAGSNKSTLILAYSIQPAQDVLGECLYCGEGLQGHGTRKRLTRVQGVRQWCEVRRFICSRCRKTFTLLPDYLLPFKHYTALEIEAVLRHLFDGGKLSESPSGAGERTLRRWYSEFSHKLPEWAGALGSRAFELSHRVSVLMSQSHVLARLEEAISCFPALPSRWAVMVKALYWLKTSHPLCLLWPP